MDPSRDERRSAMVAFNSFVTWGRVEHRAAKILIVASGPSLRDVPLHDLSDPKYNDVLIIAINRSSDWLKRWDIFFSLDPNEWLYDLLCERMLPGVHYYIGVPDDYGMQRARWVAHRKAVVVGPSYLKRNMGPGYLKSKYMLSEDPASINTGNSAYGALGVAYHMQPKKIGILGLDGTKNGYAYGPGSPNGSLAHLPALFRSTMTQLRKRGIRVLNGSPNSMIACFPRCHPSEVMEWLIRD